MTDLEVQKIQSMFEKSDNTRETEVTLFGNRNTIIEIITLLSYIRNAITNGEKKTIKVNIGQNIDNRDFEFLVNNSISDNLICKDELAIN